MILFLLFTLIAGILSQDIRAITFHQIIDTLYQCIEPGCSSFNTLLLPSISDCEWTCLSEIQCRTITFDPSNNHCNVFIDIPSQYGYLLSHVGIITMTAIDDRQLSARE